MADNEAAEKDLQLDDEQGDDVTGGFPRAVERNADEATLDAKVEREGLR